MELPILTRGAVRLGVAVGLTLAVSGCQSCAGISDLEIGAGGAGGASATGPGDPTAPSSGTEGTPASTGTESTQASTGPSSGPASTGSGGPMCGDVTCEQGEFCRIAAGQGERCAQCGERPAGPIMDCPPFCTNDCDADQRCDVDCAETPHCDQDPIILDAKPAHMRLLCSEAGSCGGLPKTVTCAGPPEEEGAGAYDCRVVCEGLASCSFVTIDCTSHAGRCIVDCRDDGCEGAELLCGANECIICGPGREALQVMEDGTCKATYVSACPPL